MYKHITTPSAHRVHVVDGLVSLAEDPHNQPVKVNGGCSVTLNEGRGGVL